MVSSSLSSLSLSRRHLGVLAGACAGALMVPALLPAHGQADDRAVLRIAAAGLSSVAQLPLVIARELDFFAHEGARVQVLEYPGNAQALQAVHQGDADLCCSAFGDVVRLQSQGREHRCIALLSRTPQLALAVLPARWKLLSARDFEGLRVGVASAGDASHYLASLWLRAQGVDLRRVRFVSIGEGAEALQAVKAYRVDALCLADPVVAQLEQMQQVRVLVDARSLPDVALPEIAGMTVPGMCLHAPRVWLEQQRDGRQTRAALQSAVQAMVRAMRWLQSAGPSDVVRTVPATDLLGDRGVYLNAFQRAVTALTFDGQMPPDGPQAMLRMLSTLPGMRALDRVALGKTYTNALARKAAQKYARHESGLMTL